MEVLKRVVIKEELVELTKDYRKAILLNQFLYWSQRIRDFDTFIKEENKRMNNSDTDDKPITLQRGWIYKSAEELIDETMLGVSKQTIGRLLNDLCENKWLERRRNPKYKWDKTYQYRVNLIKICHDLYNIGYILQDYKGDLRYILPCSNRELHSKHEEHHDSVIGTTIPENTTETTTETNLHFLWENDMWEEMQEEYVSAFLTIRSNYIDKQHKRISSSNIEYIKKVIHTLSNNNINLDVFIEGVDSYFKNVNKDIVGDMVYFMQICQKRVFDIDYKDIVKKA